MPSRRRRHLPSGNLLLFCVILLATAAWILPESASAARRSRKPLPSCDGYLKEHNSCDAPILDTPEFTVFWSKMTRGRAGFMNSDSCYYIDQTVDSKIAVSLSLVFKTKDPKFSVPLDDAYKRRLESQILPALSKLGCKGNYDTMFIGHYLEKVFIAGGVGPIFVDPKLNNQYRFPQNMSLDFANYGEIPLSSLLLTFNKQKPVYEPIQSPLGVESATLEAVMASRQQRIQAIEARQAARAAEEDERFRQSFRNLEKGLKQIGKLMEPILATNDAIDAAATEDTGVFYRGVMTGRTGVTLCNKSGEMQKVASLIEYSPRVRNFDPSRPTEIRSRGWGILENDTCKTLVTGASGLALLRIHGRDGRIGIYNVPKIEGTSFISRPQSQVGTTFDFAACGSLQQDFDFRVAKGSDARNCSGGLEPMLFPYAF